MDTEVNVGLFQQGDLDCAQARQGLHQWRQSDPRYRSDLHHRVYSISSGPPVCLRMHALLYTDSEDSVFSSSAMKVWTEPRQGSASFSGASVSRQKQSLHQCPRKRWPPSLRIVHAKLHAVGFDPERRPLSL